MAVCWLLGMVALAVWALPMLELWRASRRTVHLRDVAPDGPERLPRLSIVVPALNEAATVEQAMRTLLALDYPALEIIAVDDRSTDRTGSILDGLAAESLRLRVVHVEALPPGWLGKNHALHVGSERASGDYLLFTDADVHFEQSSLRRAARYAMAHDLDHLTLFPELGVGGFWETTTVWFFGAAFFLKFRPWKARDPRSRAFMGIGAFNLVRADAYRRMGGHASLPMDIADDMKLGKRMKESGGRADCLSGEGMVRVRWVTGLRGIVAGLTKNAFAGVDYSPVKVLVSSVGLFVIAVWPAFGLWVGPLGARLLCACALACMVWLAGSARPAPGASPLHALGFPFAALVIIYILFRSMAHTYRQGGVLWRGTLYPLEELRKGVV